MYTVPAMARTGVSMFESMMTISKFIRVTPKNSPRMISFQVKRWFIDPVAKGIQIFKNRCHTTNDKYGSFAMDFKKRFKERLEDESSTLWITDCKRFICLADKDDMPTVLRMMSRYKNQVHQENATTFDVLDVYKKYYVLSMPEELLEFYRIYKDHSWMQLAIVVDLLYECGQYQQCLDISYDYALSHESLMHQIHSCAAAAAYKLNSTDSLNKAAFLYDHRVKSEKVYGSQHQLSESAKRNTRNRSRDNLRLLALLCINQNKCSAALRLLEKDQQVHGRSFIEMNITALALIRENLPSAVNIVQRLVENYSSSTQKSVKLPGCIFSDLFTKLQESKQEDAQAVCRAIELNRALVVDKTTAEYIISQIPFQEQKVTASITEQQPQDFHHQNPLH